MEKFKIIARWILFIPAAFAAGALAVAAYQLVNRLSGFLHGFDPASPLHKAWLIGFSGAIMGAAFVYVGAKVAPLYKKQVASWLAGLGILFIAAGIAFSFAAKDYWEVYNGLAAAAGAGLMLYVIHKGKVQL